MLYHRYLTETLTLMGGSLFSSQPCASLGKMKFHQNSVFCKTWVQKKLPSDKEYHLRLKNLFIREYPWNPSLAIHTLIKL